MDPIRAPSAAREWWLALASLLLVLLALSVSLPAAAAQQQPRLQLPELALQPQQLAVLVNDNDARSVAIGDLYVREHRLPPENLLHLRLPRQPVLTPEQFAPIQQQLQRQLPQGVQALLATWLEPWRVGCMSLTAALAMGYDARHCGRKPAGSSCSVLPDSPYFDSSVREPWPALRLRPAMLLGAADLPQARALIQRGLDSRRLAASGTTWSGSVWLLSTSDKNRNVRAVNYPKVQQQLALLVPVHIRRADVLRDQSQVLGYFTGLPQVEDIASNEFLPGAVADHLTSFGGMLTTSSQMSALAWLKAGATGSYGTVTEPCAMPQKFPDPAILLRHYLAGETLIQAYWKSVRWPTEGIFIGNPLARPGPGYRLREHNGRLQFILPWLPAGRWHLQSADSPVGPWQTLGSIPSPGAGLTLTLPLPVRSYYRLQP